MGTWCRNDASVTSLRRIEVVTTSCACWNVPPPHLAPQYSKPWPRNILNLPTPMTMAAVELLTVVFRTLREWRHFDINTNTLYDNGILTSPMSARTYDVQCHGQHIFQWHCKLKFFQLRLQIFSNRYSCLTYSDALTYSEYFSLEFRFSQTDTVVWPIPTHSPILKYFEFITGVKQSFGKYTCRHFVNTYWMKPHTIMGSFLYEGYWKRSLKQIDSAVLASQFICVLGLLSKKVRTISV